MKYMELAPEKGKMYALYTDRMEYKAYSKEQLPSEEVLAEGLLELHLFDANKEYRYINKRNGQIECCIDDDTPYEDIYEEKIYTLDLAQGAEHIDADPSIAKDKIGVVNYITYDENDLMIISNYRLKEVQA